MVYFIEMNIEVNGEDQMKALGERIGKLLHGGDYIELVGDVGAGKTTLTKGIAVGMGIVETVQSPTFTINRTYQGSFGVRLSHYDFYRLNDAGIMADELAESADDADTAIVIEWGDVVADILPADHLRIEIASPAEAVRTLTLKPSGERATALAGELA